MSEIKVNKISPRTACGTTTLGDSGDTFTIPAGVTITNNGTQTGFGREGSVNWQTSSIKTTTFTAVSGEGYFINQGSQITANLPAGSAGAIVAFSDYARNFATYNFTISPNGSDKIGGVAEDATLDIDGQAATFVYVDATKGWVNVQNAEDTETGTPPFIAATGGTILTNGNFKTHVFTGPGTFCVTSAGTPAGSNTVDYTVIAGGGSGGVGCSGGGGGAGGFRLSNSVGCVPAPTMSPLVAPNSPSPAGLPVAVQGYPITVGGGGAGKPNSLSPGIKGSDSIFSTITSAGGGLGGGQGVPSPSAPPSCRTGGTGGSGGGGAHSGAAGGAGNTPPVAPAQGQNGAASSPSNVGGDDSGGGGGGAGAAAAVPVPNGGIGSFIAEAVFGPTSPSYGEPGPVSSTRYFAGGGGGGARGGPTPSGSTDGGVGGGGNGARGPSGSGGPESSGTANTGGGGGGAVGPGGGYTPSGGGGSGIVIIRYKFQ